MKPIEPLTGLRAPRPRLAAPKRRLVAQARAHLGELEPWFAKLRQDAQANGLDNDAIHQRITRYLAEHQRRDEKQ